MYQFLQLSSLEKVMLGGKLRTETELTSMSGFRNETLSYQIAYTALRTEELAGAFIPNQDFKVTVESALAPYITLREVESVPVAFPDYGHTGDPDILSREPGLFPDLLMPMSRPYIIARADKYHSLWVTVKLDGSVPAGTYPVVIRFEGEKGLTVCKQMQIEILDAMLPPQELLFSQWFHTDCIATHYGVKVFSAKHWELIEKFMIAARESGINTILTPLFTPPLDTAVGKERPTVQLVDVEKDADGYHFGFDKLRRWVALAKKCGMVNFEMSHLFTQWGVKAAPKVVVKVNGRNKKLFGWHTPATGEAYKTFLQAFLPELLRVLEELGIEKNSYFHISDEPHADHLPDYLAAKAIVAPYLKGYPIMDALSDLSLYQEGAVDRPIVVTSRVTPFLEAKVPDLMVYYCCSPANDVCNGYISMPANRVRALGLQMYKYDIKGFLQWGFNFYYSQNSKEAVNPFLITDAKGAFPSGDAFRVYPGPDGPWDSMRIPVFYDGLQDVRALRLLESYMGREETIRWMEQTLGEEVTFVHYVHAPEALLGLREAVNQKIKEYL